MTEAKHTSLDLLRHGQLAIPGIFCAGDKAIVSDEGMQNLFNATASGQWDVIISSPQDRCRLFAEKLAEEKHCELHIDAHFKEMDFGDWVDIKNETLWQDHKEQYQQLWQTPDNFVAPNGESMKAFYQRVQSGLDKVLTKYQNQSVLLITHGGVIRSILANALDIPTLSVLKFNIAYAEMSRLHYYSDGNYSLQSLGNNTAEKTPKDHV